MRRRLPLYLLAFLGACDRAASPPAPGHLRIVTTTAGVDSAPVDITLDGVQFAAIGPSDSLLFTALAAGPHTLLLTPRTANCTVHAENPRTVQVAERALSFARFGVTCVAVSGVIEVTTTTQGLDGPLTYFLSVDGGATRFLDVNASAQIIVPSDSSWPVRASRSSPSAATRGSSPCTPTARRWRS